VDIENKVKHLTPSPGHTNTTFHNLKVSDQVLRITVCTHRFLGYT